MAKLGQNVEDDPEPTWAGGRDDCASIALATESGHRVTRVTSLILPADVGDQRLRALHLDFESSHQCIFRVNDDVASFPVQLETDGKLQLRSSRAR